MEKGEEVEENDKHDYLPTEDGARCPASPPHCCELARMCNTEQQHKYIQQHTIKIQNIHFGNPILNSGVLCIFMYLMYCYVSLCDPSSPIVLRACLKSCAVVRQVHRLYCVVLFVL